MSDEELRAIAAHDLEVVRGWRLEPRESLSLSKWECALFLMLLTRFVRKDLKLLLAKSHWVTPARIQQIKGKIEHKLRKRVSREELNMFWWLIQSAKELKGNGNP